MGEQITQGQFYASVQQLRDLIELRADKIEAIIQSHAVEDTHQFKVVSDRLLVIETERAGEKAQAVKRATWVGMLAAAAMTGFWKAVEHFSK